ncbi:alpha/beta fold hydrolase [Pelomonas sp. Root1444]|uniref:alpha/beta fold hydrolase n=1 Tax=Pelomonas sp. Root1444 TaxID=1736464 RepID=UPI0009EACB98|nr:alpha/beta hydrolase [Pelomonas sp. Root1444]
MSLTAFERGSLRRWAIGVLTALVAALAQVACSLTKAPLEVATMPTHTPHSRAGHEAIRGVDYHYEIHGDGPPLLVLHGGLGDLRMMAPLVPLLARQRQVILVDLQGHGRTPLGERPLSRQAMADDMAELLTRLGVQQADAMGYSLGGWVALRLAVQHPRQVRRLVLVSTPFANDGWYPDIVAQQSHLGAAAAPAMRSTPLHKAYAEVAPRPGDFPALLDAVGGLLRERFDWTVDARQLRMPVLLVYADADMIRPEHMVLCWQALGGGLRDPGWQREHMPMHRLAVLPDLTHYEIFASPKLAGVALPFLQEAAPH